MRRLTLHSSYGDWSNWKSGSHNPSSFNEQFIIPPELAQYVATEFINKVSIFLFPTHIPPTQGISRLDLWRAHALRASRSRRVAMPSKKSWWGSQLEFTTTDKDTRKRTVMWGKPLINLCNPDEDPSHSAFWNEWYDQNTIKVVLDRPLY